MGDSQKKRRVSSETRKGQVDIEIQKAHDFLSSDTELGILRARSKTAQGEEAMLIFEELFAKCVELQRQVWKLELNQQAILERTAHIANKALEGDLLKRKLEMIRGRMTIDQIAEVAGCTTANMSHHARACHEEDPDKLPNPSARDFSEKEAVAIFSRFLFRGRPDKRGRREPKKSNGE